MKNTALSDAAKTFATDQNAEALLDAVKKHFNIDVIAEEVIPYLQGKTKLKGYYFIQTFKKCCGYTPSYQKLFEDYGDSLFPALNFGGDGQGVEFWLLLETGQVITLHHDATFYEVAGDIKAASGPEFTQKFAQRGSLFSLTQLLQLQAHTIKLYRGDDDFGKGLMKAAAQALGISLRATAAYFSDSRFELVFSHLGDLYDDEDCLEEFLNEEEG